MQKKTGGPVGGSWTDRAGLLSVPGASVLEKGPVSEQGDPPPQTWVLPLIALTPRPVRAGIRPCKGSSSTSRRQTLLNKKATGQNARLWEIPRPGRREATRWTRGTPRWLS